METLVAVALFAIATASAWPAPIELPPPGLQNLEETSNSGGFGFTIIDSSTGTVRVVTTPTTAANTTFNARVISVPSTPADNIKAIEADTVAPIIEAIRIADAATVTVQAETSRATGPPISLTLPIENLKVNTTPTEVKKVDTMTLPVESAINLYVAPVQSERNVISTEAEYLSNRLVVSAATNAFDTLPNVTKKNISTENVSTELSVPATTNTSDKIPDVTLLEAVTMADTPTTKAPTVPPRVVGFSTFINPTENIKVVKSPIFDTTPEMLEVADSVPIHTTPVAIKVENFSVYNISPKATKIATTAPKTLKLIPTNLTIATLKSMRDANAVKPRNQIETFKMVNAPVAPVSVQVQNISAPRWKTAHQVRDIIIAPTKKITPPVEKILMADLQSHASPAETVKIVDISNIPPNAESFSIADESVKVVGAPIPIQNEASKLMNMAVPEQDAQEQLNVASLLHDPDYSMQFPMPAYSIAADIRPVIVPSDVMKQVAQMSGRQGAVQVGNAHPFAFNNAEPLDTVEAVKVMDNPVNELDSQMDPVVIVESPVSDQANPIEIIPVRVMDNPVQSVQEGFIPVPYENIRRAIPSLLMQNQNGEPLSYRAVPFENFRGPQIDFHKFPKELLRRQISQYKIPLDPHYQPYPFRIYHSNNNPMAQ